ncbi:MAG: secD [Thermomicrobiales bacterium]|nr:secD [Thermomicrobiales bacterium]
MRNRTWLTLAFIILLAVVSTWISLPGSDLDIAGFRAAHPVRRGLDLQGGLQVVLQARPVAGQTLDSDTLEGTRQTLERRVNGLGVSEPLIQTRGEDQVIIELPGVDDPQEAIALLQQTALLEIIDPLGQYLPPGTLVNTTLGPADDAPGAEPLGSDATPGAAPVAATPVADGPSPTGPVYETIVSGADLKNAYVTTGNTGMNQVVGFELQGDASSKFFQYTSSHLGQPMSIPLEVIQSRTVGPTLGQDSLQKSILAGVIGLSVVALFMILYYRVPGLISVIALLIYTAVVFAIFKLLPVTLTLAGIAGFILSIGMAVDANVLIFARIKEELHQGRSLAAAVEQGFAHAWPSIRDSNITTMITTFILYLFGNYTGTSIITGFALTLFIGVVISMFTAITVTRTLLRVLVALVPINPRLWFGLAGAESRAVTAAAD